MKAIVGIVGPEDSVALIKETVEEFSHEINANYFIYRTAEETIDIVKNHQHEIDFWLFSGPTPYTWAKKSGVQQIFFYLRLNGPSLMKAFFQVANDKAINLERASIDLLEKQEVYETYEDNQLSMKNVHLFEYEGYTPTEEIIRFHEQRYNSGEVTICFTCLQHVYDSLTKQNIPVHRLRPVRTHIRETIKLALEQRKTYESKQTQISVIMFQFKTIDKLTNHNSITYDIHKLHLRIQSILIDFAETIEGSFVTSGIGTYHIFSTRGSLDQVDYKTSELLHQIETITDQRANIGIGYGNTALTAEEHARLGLDHANKHPSFQTFLVEEDKKIEAIHHDHTPLAYESRNVNQSLLEKLKQAGVNSATFSKLQSLQSHTDTKTLTTFFVSQRLKMTQRNASRILKSLVDQNLAKVVGEEAATAKGRPRQLFQIH
ncbi:hypothetical protein [Geomicrobium sediminis]|uniref:Transcriptional regulator n=1 Tax=Geomicrobium sediminis TaxID=1347788 RepID=A0ABS2PAE0_9BACL|nr:hypothetical protein [Geomicrobium sediminis]MBM7632279.1 hypothetical protein [Geomicrobium sediminis]